MKPEAETTEGKAPAAADGQEEPEALGRDVLTLEALDRSLSGDGQKLIDLKATIPLATAIASLLLAYNKTSQGDVLPAGEMERLRDGYLSAVDQFAETERGLIPRLEEAGISHAARLQQLLLVLNLYAALVYMKLNGWSMEGWEDRSTWDTPFYNDGTTGIPAKEALIPDALARIAKIAGYPAELVPLPDDELLGAVLGGKQELPVVRAGQVPPLANFIQANDRLAHAVRREHIIDGGLHMLDIGGEKRLPVTVTTLAGKYSELYPGGRLTGEEQGLLNAAFSLCQERGTERPISYTDILTALHGKPVQSCDDETAKYLWSKFEKFSITRIWLDVSEEKELFSLDGMDPVALIRGVPLLDCDPVLVQYENGETTAGIVLKSPPIIGQHAMSKKQVITTPVKSLPVYGKITKQGKKSAPVRMETWRQCLRLFIDRRVRGAQNRNKKATGTKAGKALLKKSGQALEAYQRTISADELIKEYAEVRELGDPENVSRNNRSSVITFTRLVLDNMEHDNLIRGYSENFGRRNRTESFTLEF